MPDREFLSFKERLDQTYYDRFERGGKELYNMVQIRADRTRKVGWYYHDDDLTIGPGMEVVVETERGTASGVVLTAPEKRLTSPKGARKIIRPLSSTGDPSQEERILERQEKARESCNYLAAQMRLDMKLVDIEYVPWENRTVFFFVSDGRIDFRELVKELSRSLRCRIEMRQIGPRDETKMVGGMGRCGREHCCSSHLTEFKSVRTRMAKEQGLVVNQEKITGHCRKLLCCLGYERETYAQLRDDMPPMGAIVDTPDGPARVAELHIIRQQVKVRLLEGKASREYAAYLFLPAKKSDDGSSEFDYVVKLRKVKKEKSDLEKSLPGLADRMPTQEEPRTRRRRKRSSSKGRDGGPAQETRGEAKTPKKSDSGGNRRRPQRGSKPAEQKPAEQKPTTPRPVGDANDSGEKKPRRRRRRRSKGSSPAPTSE